MKIITILFIGKIFLKKVKEKKELYKENVFIDEFCKF